MAVRIELTVEEFRALFGVAPEQVCGRSYDGKCPMPRPEPVPDCDANLTRDVCHVCGIPLYASDPQVIEGGLAWHAGCFYGKNGPKREEPEPPPPDDEPCGDPNCYTCGAERRQHEQIQHGRAYGGPQPYPVQEGN